MLQMQELIDLMKLLLSQQEKTNQLLEQQFETLSKIKWQTR